ncbi:exopolysaccharide production protein ExoY [Methylobacterium pseudosasicola]|uniref:Exopolysaccharide production protein ExoY n=2 Tax=Methylobacterium pseudosasicola TaxID=582667 RepID=A0A1I4TG62_9HYPH|nr:sugar transferase [Methylobacterium pseudosasicola]SFM75704.1 exopolysaccharide production protein ExoY [Methylobacterium pseudosasicola]
MLREAGPPLSHLAPAPHHRVEMSDVADQIAGQVSEAAEAVVEAVLLETPFVARGLRLDWAAKRGLDIGVAATALFLLLPLMLVIAALVWAGDRKAPIFRHTRLGRDGRSFGCLKFRSMVLNGEAVLAAHLAASPRARAEWAATHKLSHDPRITAIGQVLRKTSLDELPQLWNVLRGEMSLVGPRPIVQAEVARYGRAFSTCFAVPPGVTGLWQVSGRSDTTYAERVALDLDYASRWSLRRDLSIMLRTVPAVLAQRGSK